MSPPATIAHYKITGKLGEGGMGAVYRAVDGKLNREVAIKVLPDVFASDPDRLARFTREAQVLAALNHPNIAAIYGVEERALVMELVPGATLKGPLPLATALDYARQIASALQAAHEKGIVHRDLKPANIVVTPAGVVKVLDFGLAAVPHAAPGGPGVDSVNSPTLTLAATQAGVILGTAAYMSPEQASGKPVDKRADIWSFGVVVMEMLTGRRVFDGETMAHTLASVLTLAPDLQHAPVQARRLLRACLQRDPKRRLQDIGDFELLLDNEPAAQVRPPSRLRTAEWISAVTVLALLAGALAFLQFREKPAEAPLARFTIQPPEGLPWTGAVLSPDGRRLLLSGKSEGKTLLFVRSMDSTTAVPLADTEGAIAPFWAHDSNWIGFSTGGNLRKISAGGGPAEILASIDAGFGGACNADGAIVAATSSRGLLKIPARGEAPQKATTTLAIMAPDQNGSGALTLVQNWTSGLKAGK